VKELRGFLGMVQYYRDLWAKRSKMLAPLTNLVVIPNLIGKGEKESTLALV
jgi:hypothetical protein